MSCGGIRVEGQRDEVGLGGAVVLPLQSRVLEGVSGWRVGHTKDLCGA